jgi:hypothetical protein
MRSQRVGKLKWNQASDLGCIKCRFGTHHPKRMNHPSANHVAGPEMLPPLPLRASYLLQNNLADLFFRQGIQGCF